MENGKFFETHGLQTQKLESNKLMNGVLSPILPTTHISKSTLRDATDHSQTVRDNFKRNN